MNRVVDGSLNALAICGEELVADFHAPGGLDAGDFELDRLAVGRQLGGGYLQVLLVQVRRAVVPCSLQIPNLQVIICGQAGGGWIQRVTEAKGDTRFGCAEFNRQVHGSTRVAQAIESAGLLFVPRPGEHAG